MNQKYKNKLKLYRKYIESGFGYINLDFSDRSAEECFLYESKGIGNLNIHDMHNRYLVDGTFLNGYYVGKRWLDWQISEWKHMTNQVWKDEIRQYVKEEYPELLKLIDK